MRAEDSRSVIITWVPADRRTWGCPKVSYVIRGTQNGQPVEARVDANERAFSVEHRFQSDPNAEWRLRVQTVNSGGASEFSQEVSTQTIQEGISRLSISHPCHRHLGILLTLGRRRTGKTGCLCVRVALYVALRTCGFPLFVSVDL